MTETSNLIGANTKRRRWKGNAVIEVALTLPVVLALSFGCVEFGYFFFVKNSVQGAAREGARTAITPTATNTASPPKGVTARLVSRKIPWRPSPNR